MAKTNTTTLDELREQGRALRKKAPRASHVSTGNVKRDPIPLLKASSRGRVEKLIPLRYGRMLESPFAFYRGSAAIQAHDLAGTPGSGLLQTICGDAHLMNFGGFATPERNFVFDMNDFDETHPGPWEWDVKRLAASFAVAARHLGFKAGATDDIVYAAIENYRQRMVQCAEMGALKLWYEKMTFQSLLKNAKFAEARKALAKAIEKAETRTHENLLPKMTQAKGGRWVMNDTPPALFHVKGASTLIDAKDAWMRLDMKKVATGLGFRHYLSTLPQGTATLLGRFRFEDHAFKVVGVGSVGTRCLVMLMRDGQDNPLFLQIKEAGRSVLAPYVTRSSTVPSHQGQRVVYGQRMMQFASDQFLGWTTGPLGREFYLRQLRDMKFSFEIETFSEFLFGRYAFLCADILARAHARSGGLAPQISGYLGKSGAFAEAIVKYAGNYADQVERDFAAFRAACRKGRLLARTDNDFRADFGA